MVTKPRRHLSRSLVVAVVAVGAISASTVALAGQAGATASSSSHSRVAVMGHKELARAVRLDCTRARRFLHHEKRLKARFEKRLHRLQGWEAKATAAGHAPRVAALKRDIVHVQALRSQALLSKAVATDGQHARALGPVCAAFARSVQAKEKVDRAARAEARAKARGERATRAKAAAAARAAATAAAAAAAAQAAAAAKAGAGTTGTTSTPTSTSTPSTAPTTTSPTTSVPTSTAPTTTPVTTPTTTQG